MSSRDTAGDPAGLSDQALAEIQQFARDIVASPGYQNSFTRLVLSGRARRLESWAWDRFLGDPLPQGLDWIRGLLTSRAYLEALKRRIEAGKAPHMAKKVKILEANNPGELARIIKEAQGASVFVLPREADFSSRVTSARYYNEAATTVEIED